jgi:putative endonuclease
MPTPRQTLGQRGENLVANYLTARGYTIVTRNWHCPRGELDLVTTDPDGEWVFVEVRTRRAPNTNSAIESVTALKRERVSAAAFAYLEAHDLLEQVPWRIDLAVVALTPDGPQIEVIRDAAGW